MREIKFRAWDKQEKRMGEVSYIKFSKVQYTHVSVRFKQKEKTVDEWFCYGSEDGSDNIFLMQYTGLKDEYGREIYEGDIVKYVDGEHSFTAIVAKDYWEWYLKGIYPADNFDFEEHAYKGNTDLEVIGNIYDNPELLGAGK